MDLIVKRAYIVLMHLRDKGNLDCVNIYNYVNSYYWGFLEEDNHAKDFIKKYFNTKQNGFEFHMD